jgi:hypothetical protein
VSATRGAAVTSGLGVVAGYALYFAALFAPALAEGRLLAPGDALLQSLPHLARLSLPPAGWEPLHFAGHPAQGDPQTMAWYPLAWLLGRSPATWNAYVLSAYVLAASTTHALLRGRGYGHAPAAVAGLGYGASGFLLAHLGHTNLIHSCAWLPLILLSLDRLRDAPSARFVATCALAVAGSVLGGHPQLAFYGLVAAALAALALAPRAPIGGVRFLACAAAGALLGLGLSAVVWLPALELAPHTLRARLDFDEFMTDSMGLDQIPRLLLPWAYGGWHEPRWSGPALPHFGRHWVEITGFVGGLPLALAGVALARRRTRGVKLLGAAGLASLLVSFGRYLPFAAVLYVLPGYQLFRVPSRHLALFSLAAALLAGIGTGTLARLPAADRERSARRAVLALAAAAAGAVTWVAVAIATGYWDRYLGRVGLERAAAMPWRNAAVVLQLLVLAGGALALLRFARAPTRIRSAWLVAAVGAELASFGLFAEWRHAPARAELTPPAFLAPLRAELERTQQRFTPALVVHAPRGGVPSNLNLLWGLPSTVGMNPLVLTRHAKLLGVDAFGFTSHAAFEPEHRALDLLASRYVALPDDPSTPPALQQLLAAAGRWQPVARGEGALWLENRRAQPRAWLVGELITLAPDAVDRAIATGRLPDGGDFDPARTALVEEEAPAVEPCPGRCGEAVVVRSERDRVELRVRSQRDAFLVLSDAFYPGWQAEVDARRARVLRADGVLRGVVVPAGERRVVFAFRPPVRRVAIALALGAALLVGALLAAAALRAARCGSRGISTS